MEEIRFKGVEPAFLFKSSYRAPDVNWFTCVYGAVWKRPIQRRAEEISWGAFMTEPDLIAKLDQWRFVPGGLQLFRRYLAEREN